MKKKYIFILILLVPCMVQGQDTIRWLRTLDTTIYIGMPSRSQPPPAPAWYKITKAGKKAMISSAAAGAFYGLNKAIQHHHFGRGNQFWDYNVSWKNKYRDYDAGDTRQAYPMSKNVLVFTTDGYHLSQFAYRSAWFVTLAFAFSDKEANNFWGVLKNTGLCLLTERVFFNVVFAALGSH